MSSNNNYSVKAVMAICGVFIGCMSNMVFLELLVKEEPGIGGLVTFLQFLFIAIHGFIFTVKFGTVKRYIALKDYLIIVVMFYLVNVLNNIAFDYNIPVPLHMIFRSGSLIANMILGIILLKKRYTLSKYLSVVLITIGISICTIVSSGTRTASCTNCDPEKEIHPESEEEYIFRWILGITILTVALLISARLGLFQEYLTATYGKHPEEALFYIHLLSLPAFGVLYNNISNYITISNNSSLLTIPILNVGFPSLWVYLVGNVLTQYLCISSVYVLTSEFSSLTVTLVITLRKFFSLLFSIMYFKNPFTFAHWVGTIMVFGGTFIFTELPKKIQESMVAKAKVKSQ